MTTSSTLPKVLYVKVEVHPDDPTTVRYVVATSLLEMTEGWEEGDRVGRYEWCEDGTLHVTRAIR